MERIGAFYDDEIARKVEWFTTQVTRTSADAADWISGRFSRGLNVYAHL